MNSKSFDKIVVLDFGSQYNQLIARRVRELGVYSELLPCTISIAKLKAMHPKGIIFSGGPDSVYDKKALKVDPKIFKLGIPILGICYGMQLMAYDLGGQVKSAKSQYGHAQIKVTTDQATLFHNLPKQEPVWMSHSDLVSKVPDGFTDVATSPNCPIAAMQNNAKHFYGIQFHAEVNNTKYGKDILKRFVLNVCHAKANWSMTDFIDMQIEQIRHKVGDKKVILALSGGVDSSVVAVLLHRAIGHQLTCIFVDHGLLRKNEADQVMSSLHDDLGLNIVRVNAQKEFLDRLKGVADPETKRKIIGHQFIKVFDREAHKIKDVAFLAQGTIYPDRIESGLGVAAKIKSHHNVGGLPKKMHLKLIEPLKYLFKDEVRAVGTKLGIPDELVWRQPFPGPGLAIRVIGAVTPDKLRIVRDSDAILRKMIKQAGLNRKIWQYFTVLPGFKSVGVMGDQRTYDYTIAIRAITSIDGMTADFARIPWDVMSKISTEICDKVNGVNRVVYDVTSKPPSTIEWE
ncbi:glutamine-hydrolyzing GMP synthase [Acetilactobacillus jinshanensis]|uniref:GMP synthase [glutamine-hydrolyzing] n=1 Tax=Acetilactobacillus jinshanensis TaxID=1720083 RepID=A0A4P6ZKP3_9LACO|nr:glutamine-hydrolyzing GMP synthase [Acetilactobacillus jinshanensis]QBP18264.1 glutamine-hydrolyzing GMP synthase [Acetilactobacillus jinshanensis]URL61120.1 glutamine-hydrolyzing GMP synthase [uncultured bacterium]